MITKNKIFKLQKKNLWFESKQQQKIPFKHSASVCMFF